MRILMVSALLAAFSTPAFADDNNREPASDDCARARKLNKKCELTIEAEKVNGKTPKNDLPPVVAVDWGKAGSLIRIRRDFIAEIIKSAEDL